MHFSKNNSLQGSLNKPIAVDIFYLQNRLPKPVVIYAHGFNGFKDWANFDLIAKQFAQAGFVFIKFNFSHNGTTPQEPEDFVDLAAYAENNYTKELDDLQLVINWALNKTNSHAQEINAEKLCLIGHSRGGGIAIIKAAEEKHIMALATWASVSECKTPWTNWDATKMQEWKSTGVQYTLNSRTQQQMPLHYQLYENYVQHAERLNILKAISSLSIPILICHGTKDEAVTLDKAYELQQANPAAKLFLVISDHVFGRKHPFTSQQLPSPMQQVVNETIIFFQAL